MGRRKYEASTRKARQLSRDLAMKTVGVFGDGKWHIVQPEDAPKDIRPAVDWFLTAEDWAEMTISSGCLGISRTFQKWPEGTDVDAVNRRLEGGDEG